MTDKAASADALKNRRVFTQGKEIFGIPAKLFVAGIAIFLGLSFTLAWWCGLVMAAIYFPVVYETHLKDPHAVRAWERGLKRKYNLWVAGCMEPVTLKIMMSDHRGPNTHSGGNKK